MAENLSIKESVYNGILEDIFSYTVKPGDIITESSLMAKYGCSKTPVREALLSLCNDYVLRSIPRFGYEILGIRREDVIEMLQYRYIIESNFLLNSFEKFTSHQLKILEDINIKCSDENKDIWEHWDWNVQFHLKMLSFCNNSYAVNTLAQCLRRLKRGYAQFYWENSEIMPLSIDTRNHEHIIAAIREKNAERLVSHLKEDINDFGGIRLVQSEFSLI